MPSPALLAPDEVPVWESADIEEAELLRGLDRARLPRHLAVIMDGNGRWARLHHRPRIAGHQAGVDAVRSTVESCARLGIPALTLYAFSAENWKRPATEVRFLMALLRRYLRAEVEELNQQNIRLEAIGRLQELPDAVRRDLDESRAATRANSGLVLTLALNYGARAELVDACQAAVDEAAALGRPPRIDAAAIERHLYTARLPELDLVIRTSGEMRVSNFLLWQIAYAEFWVTPVLWPDFNRKHLLSALHDYQKRERRFGGLVPSDHASEPEGRSNGARAPRGAQAGRAPEEPRWGPRQS